MSKICPECGKNNIDSAKFCYECGNDLKNVKTIAETNVKSNNLTGSFKKWWNERSTNGKAATGILTCCIGVFLLVLVVGALAPESTALSMSTTHVQIDENTTEYIINGTTEPNAKVYINSSSLNLTNVEVAVDNTTGNFEYKLKILIDITDIEIKVNSKSPEKLESSQSVTIQRPLTPLTLNPIPTLKSDSETVTIEGKTDPNAEVKIASSNLNISETTIKADSNGNFNHVLKVPTEISSASVLIKVKSLGKRINEETRNITRESAPPATNTNIPLSNSTSTGSSDSTNGGSSPGDSSTGSSKSSSGTTGSYIANANTGKYHYAWCNYVDRMKESNKVPYSSSEAAKAAGYVPCKVCNP